MSLLVRVRELHRAVAPLVLLPLFVTVCSGVGYRLARDWLGFERDQVHWLMTCLLYTSPSPRDNR